MGDQIDIAFTSSFDDEVDGVNIPDEPTTPFVRIFLGGFGWESAWFFIELTKSLWPKEFVRMSAPTL